MNELEANAEISQMAEVKGATTNAKPWYQSLTIISGIGLFVAASLETSLPLWYPPVTRQELIGVGLKTLPLLVTFIGVMYGRYRAGGII